MDPMPAATPPAPPMAPPSAPASAPPPVEPPPAPVDGYEEYCVRDLLKAVNNALSAVSKALGREAPKPPEPPKELFVKKKMMQPLPAFLVEEVANLLALASQVGGKQPGRYDVDLGSLLATSDGVDKVSDILNLMAKDKMLLDGIKAAAKAGNAAPPPPAKGAKPEEVVEEETEEVEAPAPASASTYM